MGTVIIGAEPMRLAELLDIVAGARVELGPGSRSRIADSRAVVDEALATGAAIYGLNTGVGHMKDVRLPDEELRRSQEMLLATHAGGLGPPLDGNLVRAAMAVRLNGIARGGSGASPTTADVLAAMLNAHVHPVVPQTGSVGAGDLGQMAAIGLVAIGRGRAQHGEETLPGAEALRRAGITPLVLEPKDGLTLMSSNGVSVGHGALVVSRAHGAAARADVVAALSLEAIRGNPSIAQPIVGSAKPFPGQIESCRAMLQALEGSSLLDDSDDSRSVQDALSFRVAPQVHGAFREAVASTDRAVQIELNSQSDNPLVSIEDRTMVHNGNFHPITMAIAFDTLRIALAHVGQLSERRMSHLWDAFFARISQLGPPPRDGEPPELFGLSLRYPAAATFAELKQLAAPATLDCPPLDIGAEDHATSAPLAVRKTESALRFLEDLLTIEALLARDVLTVTPDAPNLGTGSRAVLGRVNEAIAPIADDRSPAAVHRVARSAMFPRFSAE